MWLKNLSELPQKSGTWDGYNLFRLLLEKSTFVLATFYIFLMSPLSLPSKTATDRRRMFNEVIGS